MINICEWVSPIAEYFCHKKKVRLNCITNELHMLNRNFVLEYTNKIIEICELYEGEVSCISFIDCRQICFDLGNLKISNQEISRLNSSLGLINTIRRFKKQKNEDKRKQKRLWLFKKDDLTLKINDMLKNRLENVPDNNQYLDSLLVDVFQNKYKKLTVKKVNYIRVVEDFCKFLCREKLLIASDSSKKSFYLLKFDNLWLFAGYDKILSSISNIIEYFYLEFYKEVPKAMFNRYKTYQFIKDLTFVITDDFLNHLYCKPKGLPCRNGVYYFDGTVKESLKGTFFFRSLHFSIQNLLSTISYEKELVLKSKILEPILGEFNSPSFNAFFDIIAGAITKTLGKRRIIVMVGPRNAGKSLLFNFIEKCFGELAEPFSFEPHFGKENKKIVGDFSSLARFVGCPLIINTEISNFKSVKRKETFYCQDVKKFLSLDDWLVSKDKSKESVAKFKLIGAFFFLTNDLLNFEPEFAWDHVLVYPFNSIFLEKDLYDVSINQANFNIKLSDMEIDRYLNDSEVQIAMIQLTLKHIKKNPAFKESSFLKNAYLNYKNDSILKHGKIKKE